MTPTPQVHVTIYTPGSALRQPSRLVADMFRGVWRGAALTWSQPKKTNSHDPARA